MPLLHREVSDRELPVIQENNASKSVPRKLGAIFGRASQSGKTRLVGHWVEYAVVIQCTGQLE